MEKKALSCLLSLSLYSISAVAEDHFDSHLLQDIGGGDVVKNIRQLEKNDQLPGDYLVDIYVNGDQQFRDNIKFISGHDEQLQPCFTREQMSRFDLNRDSALLHLAKLNRGSCFPLHELIDNVSMRFDFQAQKLLIALPQAAMNHHTVNERQWDEGINAGILSYQLSGQKGVANDNENTTFVKMLDGININAWRFRNNNTLSYNQHNTDWQSIDYYAEREFRTLKGELTIGKLYTDSDIFDSVAIKGVQLASDEDMIPSAMNGFSPLIRGIAKSNAQVTVSDNGNVIYQKNLPPGPFVIDDLTPVSDGGKLDITIKESDGHTTHYTQSYSTVPQLQRQGQLRYSIAAGSMNEGRNTSNLAESSFFYGLPFNFTVYGGVVFSDAYQAQSSGIGYDAGWLGGVAVDLNRSQYSAADNQYNGYFVHYIYHNVSSAMNNEITFESNNYRQNYISLSELENYNSEWIGSGSQKWEYSLSFSQHLPETNEIYLSLDKSRDYDGKLNTIYQLGWNIPFTNMTASLNFSMDKSDGDREWDKVISCNISFPLASLLPGYNTMVTYGMSSHLQHDSAQQISANGSLLEDNNLDYNVGLGYQHDADRATVMNENLNLDYKTSTGEYALGYSHDDASNYINYAVSGSAILHKDGLTLGQYTTDSLALIQTSGIAGINIGDDKTTITDSKGNALYSELQNYSQNVVRLDEQNIPPNVEFTSLTERVTPTRDAITRVSFPATKGYQLIATVLWHGRYPPFGSEIKADGQTTSTWLGERGTLYLTTAKTKGRIDLSWGENHCTSYYKLPQPVQDISRLQLICQ